MSMNAGATLLIDAIVDESERPALVAAGEQLAEGLTAASGGSWPVAVRFRASLAAVDSQDQPAVVVASLLPELHRVEESLAAIDARWRAQLQSLAGEPRPEVLICTIFRHVAEVKSDERPDRRTALRERIRRLNLLAIDLSHDTGASLADFDRVFAHLGARPLATDHRLAGRAAAEVAAYTIVSGIIGLGLDEAMSPELQEQVRQFQGPLWDIGKLVERRLALRP